jgi:iron(III) transport system permease protein
MRRVRGKTIAAIVVTLLLAWVVLYPIVIVAAGAGNAAAWHDFFTRRGEWDALWASIWISLVSVVLAAAIGIPLAFLFEWFDFPGRKTLGALVALPVVLPPLVGVIAFLFLYGESGFIARAIQAALHLEQAPWRLQGPAAILLVHAYSMYVYFYLFTRAGLARLDVSMLEAAQALGADRRRTLWKVVVPLLRPSLVGAAILTFMTSLGSFSAPYIFGGGFRVMTTQIVASKLNGDLALAMVETVVLAVVAIIALLVLRRTEGNDIIVALGKGIAPRPRPIRRAGIRRLTTIAGWGLAVLLLLPHLTLAIVSLVPYGAWTTEILPPVLNLENYLRLFAEPERLRPLWNSLWMATASTAVAVVLALAAGWLVVRGRVVLRRVIEGLLVLPWALPGTVFAIALATAFSTNAPLQLRFVLVGTAVILPLAYLVRGLPLTGRGLLAAYRQLDPSQEEAAASLGAGRWRTFARVTLPQLRPGLAAGASLAFVAGLGDIVASIVLYTFETRPISIEILSSLRLAETGVAAAFGVVLMIVSAIVLSVGARR